MTKTFWVARDSIYDGGCYVICRKTLTVIQHAKGRCYLTEESDDVELPAEDWKALGGPYLRPGAVPRRMKLTLVAEDVE